MYVSALKDMLEKKIHIYLYLFEYEPIHLK